MSSLVLVLLCSFWKLISPWILHPKRQISSIDNFQMFLIFVVNSCLAGCLFSAQVNEEKCKQWWQQKDSSLAKILKVGINNRTRLLFWTTQKNTESIVGSDLYARLCCVNVCSRADYSIIIVRREPSIPKEAKIGSTHLPSKRPSLIKN